MKRKITLLFALLVLSVSFGLFEWKSDNVKSLNEINLEMLTTPEGDYYIHGLTGTNWKLYEIVCTAYGSWSSDTEWYWDSELNVYVAGKGAGGGVNMGGSSSSSGNYNNMTFSKHVCGYGAGACYESAPDGHPCA